MVYPNKVMTVKELEAMGFPRGYLMRLFTMKGQKMAWKVGKHRNNAILFDTDELEKYRKAQCTGR